MTEPTALPQSNVHHHYATPKKTRKWPWYIAGTVGLLIVIGSCSEASQGASDGFSSIPTNNAESDVVVTDCSASGDFGMPSIKVKITNSTDRTQSYLVTVSVNDAGGSRITEANGASNSLMPGQSASVDLFAMSADGMKSCAVANVTRMPL